MGGYQGEKEPQSELPHGFILTEWNKIHKKKGKAVAALP